MRLCRGGGEFHATIGSPRSLAAPLQLASTARQSESETTRQPPPSKSTQRLETSPLAEREFYRIAKGDSLLGDIHRAVIVAMRSVGMVQMPFDQIIDMVAVGDGLVPASFSVRVVRSVPGTCMFRRAR